MEIKLFWSNYARDLFDKREKMNQELENYQQKSQEDIYLIKGKLQEKDQELENLRQQEMMNKDAIVNLSDQVNFLIKEISSMKR